MSELRAGTPFTVSDLTIVPIERVSSERYATKQGFMLYGSKEPTALVICDPRGQRAVDVSGQELPLVGLVREVPGLEAVLARYSRAG